MTSFLLSMLFYYSVICLGSDTEPLMSRVNDAAQLERRRLFAALAASREPYLLIKTLNLILNNESGIQVQAEEAIQILVATANNPIGNTPLQLLTEITYVNVIQDSIWLGILSDSNMKPFMIGTVELSFQVFYLPSTISATNFKLLTNTTVKVRDAGDGGSPEAHHLQIQLLCEGG